MGRHLIRSAVMGEDALTVSEAVERLRVAKKDHLDVAKEMIKGGDLFTLDFLAVATLNRSLCLMAGFCTLIKTKNMIAAAPLLRMQLDDCLRFSAAWIVDKPHAFASEVLGGVPIRKLKDRDGNRMTDGYLLKKLAVQYPWVTSVYEHSSGYVHLSDKHAFRLSNWPMGKFRKVIGRNSLMSNTPE